MSDITEPVIEDATLCDTLLPELICGELRVKDAERLVGRGPTTLSEVPA